MSRMAWTLALVLTSICHVGAQPSEAYVNQVDPSSRGGLGPTGNLPSAGGAYILQVPETARPAPPAAPPRRVNAQATRPASERTEPIVPQPQERVFPNVGAGVALALSQETASGAFPDVGAGVGAQ
jgi:hypothetical protein